MGKYHDLCATIIEKIGGKENLTNAFHCMTRLRLNLKDKSLVDKEGITKTKGVLGINDDASGLQIIIGTDVDNVYKEFIAMTGLEETAKIDENLEDDFKKQLSIKSIFNAIVNAFGAIMNPLVPTFVLLGVFNTVAVLIGPSFLNLVAEDSDLYTNFYYVGQAILYFLPVLLAYTASKHFKCNIYISLVLAFILVYPDFISAVTSETGYTIYGLGVTSVTYTSTVLPIILVVWIQSYVEKLVDRISPSALKVLLVPFLTVATMLPLEYVVLGPLGTIVGEALSSAVIKLREVAGPVETTLYAALLPFIGMFGISRPIFFVAMANFFANGSEFAVMPISMVISNFMYIGVVLGFILKTKDSAKKQAAIAGAISNALGGVSEPSFYGVILPNKKLWLPLAISGAIGGLLCGIFNVGYYQFGPSNLLGVIGFISAENPSNMLYGTISAIAALVAGFVLVLFMYKEDK